MGNWTIKFHNYALFPVCLTYHTLTSMFRQECTCICFWHHGAPSAELAELGQLPTDEMEEVHSKFCRHNLQCWR